MSFIFDFEKLVAKVAADKANIRKIKVDDIAVDVQEGTVTIKPGADIFVLKATYVHADGVKHKLEAQHGLTSEVDKLSIDGVKKTSSLDIDLNGKPAITYVAVDAKFIINWLDGATKRKIEIYATVGKTAHILLKLGILLGL